MAAPKITERPPLRLFYSRTRLHDSLYGGSQLFEGERLLHNFRRATLETQIEQQTAINRETSTRHRDKLQLRPTFSDFPNDFQSISAGHEDVGDQKVYWFGIQQRKRLVSVGGLQDTVTGGMEISTHCPPHGSVVVENKNGVHGSSRFLNHETLQKFWKSPSIGIAS